MPQGPARKPWNAPGAPPDPDLKGQVSPKDSGREKDLCGEPVDGGRKLQREASWPFLGAKSARHVLSRAEGGCSAAAGASIAAIPASPVQPGRRAWPLPGPDSAPEPGIAGIRAGRVARIGQGHMPERLRPGTATLRRNQSGSRIGGRRDWFPDKPPRIARRQPRTRQVGEEAGLLAVAGNLSVTLGAARRVFPVDRSAAIVGAAVLPARTASGMVAGRRGAPAYAGGSALGCFADPNRNPLQIPAISGNAAGRRGRAEAGEIPAATVRCERRCRQRNRQPPTGLPPKRRAVTRSAPCAYRPPRSGAGPGAVRRGGGPERPGAGPTGSARAPEA